MINKPNDMKPKSNNQNKNYLRFHTPDQLRRYLDNFGQPEVDLKAFPISGEPETFRYHQNEQVVTRNKDGRTFDSMDDFFCYAFQCDAGGYPRTEYVDIKVK